MTDAQHAQWEAVPAYASVDHEAFVARLEPHHPVDTLRVIEAAYSFSKYGHRGQFRDDGVTRYFEHCKSVAWIVIDEIGLAHDSDMIVMALLHDIREDTSMLESWVVERVFGIPVRVGLKALTKKPGEGHGPYLARLLACPDWRVWLLKLADRLQNLRSLGACEPDKQQRKLAETREAYLPLFAAIETGVPAEAHSAALHLMREIRRLTGG